MAISEQDQRRILGAAKALFQERKTLSLDDLTLYLRSTVNLPVEPADVEESLSRLFERKGGNLPAIELHQVMNFRRLALAYWLGAYSILVMEEQYVAEAESVEEESIRANVYLFFGIAGEDSQSGKFLGMARSTKDVLDYLKNQGIEVQGWFPLDNGQWKSLIPHTGEQIQELIRKFGGSLFSKDVERTPSVIFSL